MAGGIYEQLDWPDSRSDYVQVCDGCHTAIWSTRWNEETSDGFDAFLARNGLARLHRPARSPDPEPLPGMRGARPAPRRDSDSCRLADPPVRSYTHADQEVYAQLTARERMAANLLLTAA